jgi:hypothetical protein
MSERLPVNDTAYRCESMILRHIVAGLCAYEVAAILSGKIPTLTALDRRSRHALAPVLFGGLAAHFWVEHLKCPKRAVAP